MRAHVRKMFGKIYFEIQFWLLGNKNVCVLCCVCNDVTCSRNDCHFFPPIIVTQLSANLI